MHLIHRSKAQSRHAGLTGLRGAPQGQGQGAGCLPESTAGHSTGRGEHPLGCLRLGHTLHVQGIGGYKEQC